MLQSDWLSCHKTLAISVQEVNVTNKRPKNVTTFSLINYIYHLEELIRTSKLIVNNHSTSTSWI